MTLTRTWLAAWTIILALSSTAISGCRAEAPSQGRDPPQSDASPAWNSVQGMVRARALTENRGHPPLHLFRKGVAVSPDGALFVSATAGRPVNELDLVDIATRKGRVLSHPERRIELSQPAFSPDGKQLAFVASLPSDTGEYTGVSAIWITDLRGRAVRVISAPGRLYAAPAFSPDGRKLAYFRDVLAPPAPGMAKMPPENRALKPMALFETDLATGREARLAEQAYQGGLTIAYDEQGGLYFRSGPALVRSVRDADGEIGWSLPNLGLGQRDDNPHIHLSHLSRGRALPTRIEPSLPSHLLTDNGYLVGTAANGELLISNTRGSLAEPETFAQIVVRVGASGPQVILEDHERFLGSVGSDAAGTTLVASDLGAISEPPLFPPREIGFVVQRSGMKPQRLGRAAITFADPPIVLDPSLPPNS
ncbi:MAG: hypothetical protein Q8Q88_08510 [Phenylobacterium sp.]|uniref:TolB family protein n=1 Tax=Phenylobacterium sp. TaxID=1871053 RepID=UPI002737136D|nr:hypothetical protein [Phenylobacterium sp.]MDP3747077.1 hypothetical protein [Phenylobacterium sp.]